MNKNQYLNYQYVINKLKNKDRYYIKFITINLNRNKYRIIKKYLYIIKIIIIIEKKINLI